MAINFPVSPTNGQIFTDSNTGNRYVYDATVGFWKTSSNLTIVVADAAFNKANAANVLAYNTGISANNYAGAMANSSNAYATATYATITNAAAAFDKANNALANTTGTFVGNLTLVGTTKVQTLIEKSNTVSSAATGTITFDVIDQAVQYWSANATSNCTINVRGNSTVSLDTLLSTGQALTISFLTNQGLTAYWPNTFQIDSYTRSVRWQGGTAPTGGTANSVDSYAYTIFKTTTNTYTILASQTKFL